MLHSICSMLDRNAPQPRAMPMHHRDAVSRRSVATQCQLSPLLIQPTELGLPWLDNARISTAAFSPPPARKQLPIFCMEACKIPALLAGFMLILHKCKKFRQVQKPAANMHTQRQVAARFLSSAPVHKRSFHV
jgi:hypothetical protein